MCDRHRRHGANATPSIFQAPQRPAMHDTTSATVRYRREVSEGPRSGSGGPLRRPSPGPQRQDEKLRFVSERVRGSS